MPEPANPPEDATAEHARLELLNRIDRLTEWPLIVLSFVWLVLLILDLTTGLHPFLHGVVTAIWIIFGLDFGLGLLLAPRKGDYLKRNWLTALALLLPAVRILRVVRLFRLLRAARAARSLTLLRLLTTINRGMGAAGRVAGRHGVGYVAALTAIVTAAGAAGMAFFERPAEGGDLAGYGEALWWTAMLMTTLGSDYSPRTMEGRVLTVLLALYAFAAFGYITATIASIFIGREAAARGTTGRTAEAALAAEVATLRRQVAALAERLGEPDGVSAPAPAPQPPTPPDGHGPSPSGP